MSSSMRARRVARNLKRSNQQPKLNLVALMDIFTILVLFLMVNNGDVEVLQTDGNVSLPESVSQLRPELALIIKITESDIIVQGRSVQSVEAAVAQEGNTLEGLVEELQRQSTALPSQPLPDPTHGRAVIIMGDQDMPYKLLKRVMTTCAQQDYRDISLAVNSKPAVLDDGPQLAARGS